MDKQPPSHDPENPDPQAFAHFREMTRRLVNVPKAEADAKEAEYQAERAKHPKRGPKPKTVD